MKTKRQEIFLYWLISAIFMVLLIDCTGEFLDQTWAQHSFF